MTTKQFTTPFLRLSLLTLLASVCSLHLGAQTKSLDGEWEFALRKSGAPVPERYEGTIPVPSNWAVLGWEEPVYRGFKDNKASEGFYRTTFTLPEEFSGKRVLLHFDGVWNTAYPSLNSHFLGEHDSGYTSFAYDVTPFLSEGVNTLEVRVSQTGRYYKFDTHDDWTLGGIYQSVWLEAMPGKRWMEESSVRTVFDRSYRDATLEVSTVVCDSHKSKVAGNFPSPSESYQLRYTLCDAEGKTVLNHTEEIEGQDATDKKINKQFKIRSPHQWNAEDPYLYSLSIELLEGGEVVQTRRVNVGFREIRIEDGVLKVNGTGVKLRGVNRHEEHPDVGRATRREHWMEDILKMKQANINYVRCAHYPPAKGFIDLCDSLGMYLSDEVEMGGGDSHFRDPSYATGVLQRAYETVIRDRNNPSVIFWTIGNEDPYTAIHSTAAQLVKALDPTRPVAMPWRAEEWLSEEFDILAPHYWQPQDYENLLKDADRPMVTTEYTHAYGTNATGGLQARWKAITKYPQGAGGAVWMWQDQGIKTPVKPEKQSSLSDDPYLRLSPEGWDGVVDSYRNTDSRDLQEVKAVYAPVYPEVQSVKRRFGKVRIPVRNDFDFTDLSTVRIVWQQYCDSKLVLEGEERLKARPHSSAVLKLKTRKPEGRKADYIVLRFLRPDGSEIDCRSVRLERKQGAAAPVNSEVDLRDIVSSLRPFIWHNLDDTEQMMYSKEERPVIRSVNFNSFSVQSLRNEELIEGRDTVLNIENRYIIDSLNSFTASYEIRLRGNEARIDYSILPELQLSWIPCYGLSLPSDQFKSIEYAGLGDMDCYPNKDAAAYFGLWTYKEGIRKAEKTYCELWEGSFEIQADCYIRIENIQNSNRLLICPEVVSRPEKGRKAIEPFPLLRCGEDAPFSGSMVIRLIN